MTSPAGRIGWHYATVTGVPASTELAVVVDLGFDIHLATRLRLDSVTVPDSKAQDSAERAAGMAVQRFIADWVTEQTDQRVVVHIARQTDRACTGSVWTVGDPYESLNEVLVAEGHGLDPEGEY